MDWRSQLLWSPYQLVEYQWRKGRLDALGKLVSAHPVCRVVLPVPLVGRDQLPLSHKPTASTRALSVYD